jgi:hypothetical protein
MSEAGMMEDWNAGTMGWNTGTSAVFHHATIPVFQRASGVMQ